jgi:ketosteroid isomerase-like protein
MPGMPSEPGHDQPAGGRAAGGLRTGQIAVVTGAPAGLGLAIATALAQAGTDVVLASRARRGRLDRPLNPRGHHGNLPSPARGHAEADGARRARPCPGTGVKGMLRGMTDRDEFLAWVRTALYQAELALHNGDAAPRRALWSRNEPVSVLGAARSAYGQREIDELFTALGSSFSGCTSYAFDLQACDVAGNMAYTAGLEHTSVSVDGQPRTYTLRATQVYRRESGQWRVAHRHGDTVTR